jgi:hypothetical protein
MAWTLCTSGAAIAKAGSKANATIVASGATLAIWSAEAEAQICAATRFNWNSNYSTVGANFSGALATAATDIIAMKIISYDMGGYTSRLEAATLLDYLRDDYTRILEFLQDKKYQQAMGVSAE